MSEIKRLRLPQVIDKTGWKKTKIYELVKIGQFPAPRKDGRTSYWLASDIDDWIIKQA